MKKVLAIVIAVAMLAMLALTASAMHDHSDTTTNFWRDDKTNVKHSFDTVFVDGKSQVELKWAVDGSAAKVVTDNPMTVGENVNETIAFRGWVGIAQDTHPDVKVAEVGYYLNENKSTYVKTGELVNAEQAVLDLGGEFRFEGLTINVAGKTEPTLITIAVKGTDGNLYDFGEFSINGNYTSSGEAPATEEPTTDAPATEAPAKVEKTLTVDLSNATGSGVDVQITDGKIVATTTEKTDPWISIPLDNIDTSVYKSFIVKYSATAEIGSNNTYLMDTEKNPGYSPEQGTWTPNGMAGTGDGAVHEKEYKISDFALMEGTTLTGVRLTACGTVDGVYTIESITFVGEGAAPAENPKTADASVIAIAAVAAIALAGVVVAKKVSK